ncbi:AMSH-like ubiquitin thioesterase 3 isoform X2 [Tasmannia lanceolata]|uniref:AMSH-like ubiquitin thioesterase 3 isoform X2 n=1 Tax=Tasmannia lanceolata TaxID=3420 RepID=UPI00406346B8
MRAENLFPLSFYFRIANQIINQAQVYRDEQNIVDLYLILNRYSRLLSEIIPQHPSYPTYSAKEKLHHKKILYEIVKELESLKPLLGRKSDEINRQLQERPSNIENVSNLTSQGQILKDDALLSSERKVKSCGMVESKCHRKDFSTNCMSTASRGSGQICITADNIGLASAIADDANTFCSLFESPCSTSSTTARGGNINVHTVTLSSPSPVVSCIRSVPHDTHVSHITSADSIDGNLKTSFDGSSESKVIHDIHISARLMEEFLEIARTNTERNLETCGILGAFLKKRTFYVTTLIIPKQESTSDSTHPSQTCFMSSIDLHTHYSYQVMLPEAFAIVMAPTDPSRSYGIFRLSDPGGTSVLKECQERGFHSHQEPADGSPIYEDCSNVYINSNLRFEIIDLR